jgi:hypothetical protein
LFQELVVLAWAAAEHMYLSWVHKHQKTIRAELYSGVIDAVQEGLNPHTICCKIVLPSSITSSPHSMQKNLQDTLGLLRLFGGSDLFVTFTANPQWHEITEALLTGQTPVDCPDLVTHVFRLKFKSLLTDITQRAIFGPAVGYVYTVEYQKRPHIHLIVFLHRSTRLSTPE